MMKKEATFLIPLETDETLGRSEAWHSSVSRYKRK